MTDIQHTRILKVFTDALKDCSAFGNMNRYYNSLKVILGSMDWK